MKDHVISIPYTGQLNYSSNDGKKHPLLAKPPKTKIIDLKVPVSASEFKPSYNQYTALTDISEHSMTQFKQMENHKGKSVTS